MPDTPLFANNVRTTLAAGITAGSLTCQVSAGDGALMPAPDVYEYFVMTLKNLSTNDVEIVHCTGRSGDLLSIDRAQEGTTALPFSEGDEVSMNITAGILEYLRDN